MFETKVVGELRKVIALKRRSIVTLQDMRHAKLGKHFVNHGNDNFGCSRCDDLDYWIPRIIISDNQEILAVGKTLKSTLTSIHGPSVSGDMLYGSRDCFAGTVAWQAMQLVMRSLASLSTHGNQTFSLMSCLVFLNPDDLHVRLSRL